MKILTFLIILLPLLSVGTSMDVQKHLQYQHAFNYILEIVSEDRLGSFDASNLKRCTQSKCCICDKQFKNTTYSSIHIALHHQESFSHPQEIAMLFDDEVPQDQKYLFCHKYLAHYNLPPSQKEDVCLIVSEEYYKPKIWIDVLKYILYVGLAVVLLIYYSDISKGK